MVKTLTIKNTVYDELVKIKGREESFSDLFERLAKKEKSSILDFAGFLSDETAEKMKKSLARDRAMGKMLDSERKKRLGKLW